MRLGIVANWFNRGQGTVARHLRSALDSLGHLTFVFARPARDRSFRPGYVQSDDVWRQDRVSAASRYEVPHEEYEAWARDKALSALFFDQNYQFDEIRALREAGIRTVGRFVWESFRPEHAALARDAFDVIYSLTAAEESRYRDLGIRSPRVHWGCHPELFDVRTREEERGVRFFYPGGYLSRRKPTGAVVEAFRRVKSPDARLIVKSQRPLRRSDLVLPRTHRDLARGRNDPPDETLAASLTAGDERILALTDDVAMSSYHELFRSADVCLAPSRWEGLGLHLYEAVAFGLPLIVNDIPPLNEIVVHGKNGLLVGSFQIGKTRSGIPSWEPDVDGLAEAIEAMADDRLREKLREGVAQTRDELRWERTVNEIGRLLEAATQ